MSLLLSGGCGAARGAKPGVLTMDRRVIASGGRRSARRRPPSVAWATGKAFDAAPAPPGATLEGGGYRTTGRVKALARLPARSRSFASAKAGCASIAAHAPFLACRPISAVPHLSMARRPGSHHRIVRQSRRDYCGLVLACRAMLAHRANALTRPVVRYPPPLRVAPGGAGAASKALRVAQATLGGLLLAARRPPDAMTRLSMVRTPG